MGVDCDFPNPCDCGCSDDKTREAKLDRDWRNRALDGELALRVLLNRQRTGKPLDLEKYANIAMRSASVLRTDIEGDPDNQAPPPPASEALEDIVALLRRLAGYGCDAAMGMDEDTATCSEQIPNGRAFWCDNCEAAAILAALSAPAAGGPR